MSQEQLKALCEKLHMQRRCAWCGHLAETSEGLVLHILESTGDPEHNRNPLSEREQALMRALQKRGAK